MRRYRADKRTPTLSRGLARVAGLAAAALALGLGPVRSADPTAGSKGLAAEKSRPDLHGDALPSGARARLGTVRFRHDATSIAYSPDGKILASGGSDNKIGLFDAATGRKIRTLAGHQDRTYRPARDPRSPADVLIGTTGRGNVTCLSFAPDGKTLASGGWDDSVRIWDVGTGTELRKLYAHPGMVAALSFSRDGKVLASRGGIDGVVRLWDPHTGAELRKITGMSKANPWRLNREAGLALSPDGKTLAVGDVKAVRLYDVATGKEVQTLEGHRSALSVAFSPDGKLLASGGVDAGNDQNSLRLWDLGTGKELRRCELPKNEPPIALAFAPDGNHLAAAVEEDDLRVFDVATGKPVHRLGHYWPSRVLYAPDGKTLVSAHGPALRLWDAATGKELFQDFAGHQAAVAAVAVSPDGATAATGGDDLRLWETGTGKPFRRIPVKGGVTALAFSPDGKTLASAGRDRVVRLWETDTGKPVHAFTGHQLMLCGLAFSPDGKRLASGDVQSVVRVWDVAVRKELRAIDNKSGTERLSFAFSPDGKALACAGAWNDSSFLPGKGTVFTINGRQVKSDGVFKIQGVEMERKEGHRVLVWDVGTGKALLQLPGLADKLQSVAYTPDGKTLAAAGRDGTVGLWDAATGRERLYIRAHPVPVEAHAPPAGPTSVLFTPDGKTLISAGADGMVRLWDAAAGRERAGFRASDGPVRSIALAADGKTLISGHGDTTALVWDLSAAAKGAGKREEVILIQD